MEIYKVIEDFENYEVSNLGNVRNKQTKKILKPCDSKKGYKLLSLSKNGKWCTKQVHRIVAQAFIPNPHNKPIVDHKDNDRTNNKVENLRWCSSEENSWNRKSSNPLGKGISYWPSPDKSWAEFRATIYHKGINYDLGDFWTQEEAQQARYEKAKELFGEFMNECEKPQEIEVNINIKKVKNKNIKVKVNIVNEDEDEELRELIELEREFDELLKK